MSFRRVPHVEIACDEPLCSHVDDDRDVTVGELRSWLAQLGWSRRADKDFCPDHTKPKGAGV